jgi:uncharacterized protein (DUF1810 family)
MSEVDLERFVAAQDASGTYMQALRELRQGRKMSHWMWFVFPQIAGLGRSATAQRYAIASLEEARAYLRHPLLGPRLLECTQAVLDAAGRRPGDVVGADHVVSAEVILGEVDAMKLQSSMTLFSRAAPHEPLFPEVLTAYFDGQPDRATLEILGD